MCYAIRDRAQRPCNELTRLGGPSVSRHVGRSTTDQTELRGTTMATLDTKDRDKLRSSQFAYVDRDGGDQTDHARRYAEQERVQALVFGELHQLAVKEDREDEGRDEDPDRHR